MRRTSTARGRNPEPLGDQTDVLQADVSLAPLDAAEVAAVDLDGVGERLLGHALDLAELADPCPKSTFTSAAVIP